MAITVFLHRSLMCCDITAALYTRLICTCYKKKFFFDMTGAARAPYRQILLHTSAMMIPLSG